MNPVRGALLVTLLSVFIRSRLLFSTYFFRLPRTWYHAICVESTLYYRGQSINAAVPLFPPFLFVRVCFHGQKKVLKAARIVAGILNEPFGARFETDALEPWQQRVLVDLRLDGPGADLTVHLGGDSRRGRLPVTPAENFNFKLDV